MVFQRLYLEGSDQHSYLDEYFGPFATTYFPLPTELVVFWTPPCSWFTSRLVNRQHFTNVQNQGPQDPPLFYKPQISRQGLVFYYSMCFTSGFLRLSSFHKRIPVSFSYHLLKKKRSHILFTAQSNFFFTCRQDGVRVQGQTQHSAPGAQGVNLAP